MLNSFSTSPIKVGLVGTGYAAKRRAEAFRKDERSQLKFVSGHTLEQTEAFCQAYGVKACPSWEALLHDPSLDLIVICTVNCDHGKITQAALEADKNVVIEYPLSLDPQEASQLIALAQRKGKLLHVEHIELLGGLHQAIRQYLPKLGQVFYARYVTISPQRPVAHRWTYHHQLFGFPLSAALSRVHRFTDLWGTVTSVSCQARFWDIPETDYYRACLCQGQFRFANGLIAEITYGKGETFWQANRTFEIHGEEGTLIFEGDQGQFLQGEDVYPIEVASRRGLFAKDTTMVLDHLLEGVSLYTNPSASHYALQVADAAYQSSKTGKTRLIEV